MHRRCLAIGLCVLLLEEQQQHGQQSVDVQRQIRQAVADEGLTRCRCAMGQSAHAAAILLASLSASCASVRGSRPYRAPRSDSSAGSSFSTRHMLRRHHAPQRTVCT